jgi:leucyl aminopeptidase
VTGPPGVVVCEAPGPDEGVTAVGVPVLAGDDGPVVVEGLPAAVAGRELPTALDRAWCTGQRFGAKPGQALVLRDLDRPSLVLCGLGPATGLDAERWRLAGAAFVRAAGEGGTGVLAVGAPVAGSGIPLDATLSAAAEGAVLAAYRFDAYRRAPRAGALDRLVLVAPDGADPGDTARAAAAGATVAAAVWRARDLANTPPSDLTPALLAGRAEELLAGASGVTLEVWDKTRIAAERLGALLGVSRGSSEPPRLLRATYEPADPVTVDGHVVHLVFVGKGVTFDSGGLSLKTPEAMTTMKTDMSGAAVVLAAIGACGDLGVRVRVTALVPAAENMPGGAAMKPGDVVRARDGTTIEVLNTDAEGRLLLADALVLACELSPDAVVDVATLTGAATVALGRTVAPLYGNDAVFTERVRAAGARAGEQLWPMPMPEQYADHLDSDVADLKNTGRAGQAGSISAAIFLSRFVGDTPWAHLDIAGTGRSTESSGLVSKGGTGFGVRTLLALVTEEP